MKNGIRVAICVMLVVSVLAMSLSVLAVDETYEYNPYPDYIYFIWYVLNSWGIEISVNDIKAWSDETSAFLESCVMEYLGTIPSIGSFSSWVYPWEVYLDVFGVFRGNNSFLQDVQDFAEWLVVKFSLESDTTTEIQARLPYIYDDGGNKYYVAPYDSQLWRVATPIYSYTRNDTVSADESYIYWQNGQYRTNVRVRAYDGSTGSMRVDMYERNNNDGYTKIGDAGGNWGTDIYTRQVKAFYYSGGYIDDLYHEAGVYFFVDIPLNENDDPVNTSWPRYYFRFNLSVAGSDDGIAIVVGDLDVPDDSEIIDQSIEVDNNEPVYIEINWPDKISVDNLPAIVSTGTVSNPSLETFWGFIPVLAEQTKDAIVLTRGLIYELPEELVVTFYAVMGGLILFGIIKIMREH